MSLDRQEGLLPEYIELDFNGKKLSVGKKINEGATAEIFTGKLEISENEIIDVAIKVLNPAGFQFGEKDFLEEIMTLYYLMEYEKAENVGIGTDFFVAPHFYGKGSYNDTSFFVMEFIKGTRISEIMANKNSLSEKQSLIIAWNLFRTINILHTKLDKSYIDLKFNDFWWLERPDAWDGQLKLTDFGSMDPIKGQSYKVQRDMLTCSVLFFQMLSGYSLSYNTRDLRERADKLIGNLEVSWGTSSILQKMLHRNREYRYQTAQEVVSKLYSLAHFWVLTEDDLISEIQKNIDSLDILINDTISEDALNLAWVTKAGLDIWLKKTGQVPSSVQSMLLKVNKVLKTTDEIENGIKFFEMRDFELAKRNFERAVDYSEDIIRAQRWLLLSEAVRELPADNFSNVRIEVEKIEELLQEGDYPHAISRLERLNLSANSDNLHQLINEANFYQEFEIALMHFKVGELSLAAEKLAKAEEWLTKIPYAKIIIDEEGSIQDKREEIEQLRDSRGQSQKFISEALNSIDQGDWFQVLQKMEEAYASAPDGVENLPQFVSIGKKAFQTGKFSESYKVAELGLRIQRNKKELIELKTLASVFSIGESYFLKKNYISLLDFIDRKVDTFTRQPEISQILLRWLRFITMEAVKNHNFQALKDIELVANKLDLTNQTHITEDLDIERELIQEKKLRDDKAGALIGDAVAYINYDRNVTDFQKILRSSDLVHQIDLLNSRISRYKEAEQWLDQALDLADNPEKLVRIEKVKVILAEEKLKMERESTGVNTLLKSIQSQSPDELVQRYERLDLDSYKKSRNQPESNIDHQIEELLSDCYQYLSVVDAENQKVNDVVFDLCQSIDLHTPRLWSAFSEQLDDRTDEMTSVFEQVDLHYEEGKPEDALVVLNKVATIGINHPKWLQSKVKVLAAYEFLKFIRENAKSINEGIPDRDIINKLRTYIQMKLPSKYWKNAGVGQYLQKACVKAKGDMQRSKKQVEDREFLDLILTWIYAENIAQEFTISGMDGRGA